MPYFRKNTGDGFSFILEELLIINKKQSGMGPTVTKKTTVDIYTKY